MIGRTLSHYTIHEKVGEGGMGAVWRATDGRLGREVAIKVLPAEVAADPERLERFSREAQAVAALNHPNIVTIHSVEEAEGVHLLVMELVEGRSLDRLLPERGFEPARYFPLAIQIAAALAAAHDKGIIHRDLKPANVMVTAEDRVKVLDFGLAKLAETSDEEDETQLMTRDGMILGTVPYMSPEQVQARPVDHRTDLFSLGVVLYEMATGQRPFQGDNAASVISAVIKDEPPPVNRIKTDLPNHLGRIVRRCLDKDASRRFQSAREVQLELEGLARELDSASGAVSAPAAAEASGHSGGFSRSRRLVAAGGVLAVLVLGLLLGRVLTPEPERPVRRFEIVTRDPQPISTGGGRLLALSPDGTRLAYVDRGRILVRELASGRVTPVERSELAVTPFFSPDGDWLAFASGVGGELRKVWLESGRVFVICPVASIHGGTWSDDGRIVFSDGRFLRAVAPEADRSECPLLGGESPGHRYISPRFLPGGERLLAVRLETTEAAHQEEHSVVLVSATTGEELDTLVADAADPRYLETGHLLFRRGTSYFAQPFDLSRARLSGEPIPVVDDVAFADLAHFDVADDGTLAYVPDRAGAELRLVWIDRSGGEERLPAAAASYWAPRLSPDGRRLAVVVRRSGRNDLLLLDPLRGTRELFERNAYWPAWTPAGAEIAFVRQEGDSTAIWSRPVEGTARARRVLRSPDGSQGYYVLSYSRRPAVLTFYEARPSSGRDILVQRDGGPAVDVVATPGEDRSPRLSPDARHLAYVTDTSGRDEVYVRTCPPCRPDLELADRSQRVSLDGGVAPIWSRDGDELYFVDGDRMMAARIQTDPELRADPPAVLFERSFVPDQFGNPNFDLAPDGRFLIIQAGDGEAARHRIDIVVNWFQALERRLNADER